MSETALTPGTPEELAAGLGEAASRRQTITLGGRFSKNRMGGPVAASDVTVSTAGLTRVLTYEPRDLTISVEAGMPWIEFSRLLAANRQMVPLDPPFADLATVGGVLASNSSGPRRRLHGAARDVVIGMKFATLEGKLVQSGGMVVKNVAGLDMGKLLIGSFGTLAALAVVNFKLLPAPEVRRHFVLAFDTAEAAGAAVRAIRQSVLQPASLDLLNPPAAKRLGLDGYVVSVEAGGNPSVIERYERELKQIGPLTVAAIPLQEFTRNFLEEHAGGAVVRISATLSQAPEVVGRLTVPVVARAGSGVCYAHFAGAEAAAETVRGPWIAIMEFAPEALKATLDLWPSPGGDLELMRRIKRMLDPHHLLNRGRLYRHI
ncbi:MAG: FAD-binding oxidoreductase [Acidobacteria bacterium]|nr:FAD-binding oxidoreductase [Acidobacteriota bacterium]